MTAPGGDVPEGAYVGDTGQSNSIARLSDISEESAKAMMQGAAAPSFNRQRDAAWGVFNDIAYALTGVQVDENGNPITHIEDWATKDLHNVGQVIQDYGDALEELGKNRVMPWAVPTVAPLSQSINRRADPTFQLSDLMSPLVRGQSDSAGHNHQHWTTSEPYEMQRGMDTKGRIYYAFITPAVTRAYTQLNFMVSAVTNPCPMDVGVYIVNEDRMMARQVHQTDALAALGIGESVVSVRFPTFVAEQGSYLAVVFLQRGAGNTRQILGLDDTPRPLIGSVFPPKISAMHQATNFTSLPATIDGNLVSQVDFSGYWFTPYAELSEDVGIDYKMFTENWPESTSQVGRPWVPLTSQGIGSSGGHTSAWGSGLRVSMYDTPLSTDSVRVRTSIAARQYGEGYGSTILRSTLIVRGTNDLRSGIGLSAVSRTRYELVAWSGLAVDADENWDNRAVVATISRAPAQGDQIEIDYLDGLVTVRINGAVVFEDLNVAGYSGSAYRFVGIQNRRQSFITSSHSPWFGPWSARDLPQTNGDGDGDEEDGGEEDDGPIVGG